MRRRILVAFERAEDSEDDAERRRLLTFVIIGGGPTGVELAGALAELAKAALARDFRQPRGIPRLHSDDPRAGQVQCVHEKLPAVVDGATNVVDVVDVAHGHLLAAEKGKPGERYILGGYNLTWVELIDRLAVDSEMRRPLLVLPREVGAIAQLQGELRIPGPIAPEAFALMAQNWRASSRKAKRELGYRTRPLDATITATLEWYRALIKQGVLSRGGRTPLSLAAAGMRAADRLGVIAGLRAAEGYVGRRLVAGT